MVVFYRVIWSHDPGHKFQKLARFDFGFVLGFFKIDFFLILPFNIRLLDLNFMIYFLLFFL